MPTLRGIAEDEAGRTIGMFGRAAGHQIRWRPLDIAHQADIHRRHAGGRDSTLTERILSNHSQVSAGGELPFMQECLAKLRNGPGPLKGRGPDLSQRELLHRLRNDYLDALFESGLGRRLRNRQASRPISRRWD